MADFPTPTDSLAPSSLFERGVKIAPFALALATAVFYLNGRAFHQGYLQHFGLPISMFDDDVTNAISYSVRAWEELSYRTSAWVSRSLRAHWQLPLILAAAFYGAIIALKWLLALVGWVGARAKPLAIGAITRVRNFTPYRVKACLRAVGAFAVTVLASPAWARKAAAYLWLGYLTAYVGYFLCSVLALVLLVLITPFGMLGDKVAADDEAAHFKEFPTVQLSAPGGIMKTYRLLMCAPRYCALREGEMTTVVPQSQVVWLVATPPQKVPSRTQH